MLFRAFDYGSAHRVEFDISVHRHQVALAFDEAGFEAALPKCAAAAMTLVEGLDEQRLASRMARDSAWRSGADCLEGRTGAVCPRSADRCKR